VPERIEACPANQSKPSWQAGNAPCADVLRLERLGESTAGVILLAAGAGTGLGIIVGLEEVSASHDYHYVGFSDGGADCGSHGGFDAGC
jgi:hypothetical protein